jgi:hypothetical protein
VAAGEATTAGVIDEGITGFIVADEAEAAKAVGRVGTTWCSKI